MGLGVIRMEPAKRLPDGHLVDHVRGLTRPSTHHLHAHLGVGVEVLRDTLRFVLPPGNACRLC